MLWLWEYVLLHSRCQYFFFRLSLMNLLFFVAFYHQITLLCPSDSSSMMYLPDSSLHSIICCSLPCTFDFTEQFRNLSNSFRNIQLLRYCMELFGFQFHIFVVLFVPDDATFNKVISLMITQLSSLIISTSLASSSFTFPSCIVMIALLAFYIGHALPTLKRS